MTRANSGRRMAAALAGAAATAGLLAAGPAAPAAAEVVPGTVVDQPFYADSGDACRYGVTKGVLRWQLEPIGGPPRAVDISGALVDRPLPGVPPPGCGDDRRSSVAILTAYARDVVVGGAAVRADNSTRTYRFRFPAGTSAARVELVTVQVCRRPSRPGPAAYCGPVRKFPAPVS